MTPVNHWKLGLFVVLGVAAGCLTVVGLGANKLRRRTATFESFFDESVQGLSVGSPVKFRGVHIGEVALITVAPDRRHVHVLCEVDLKTVERIGLQEPGEERSAPPSNVRVQIVSQGITGVRFLGIDFFDEQEFPRPKLDFEVPDNYLPAAKSTLANLEEAIVTAAEQVPILTAQVKRLLTKLEEVLGDIEWKELSKQVSAALERTSSLAAQVEAKLEPLDVKLLQTETQGALKDLRQLVEDTGRLLERVQREGGLLEQGEATLVSARKTLDELKPAQTIERLNAAIASVDSSAQTLTKTFTSIDGVARDSRDLPRELSETLRSLERAAREIRDLAELLQRDSDMLLKGRARK